MAFNLQNFATVSSSANKNAQSVFSYSSLAETLATIIASAYFNDIASRLKVNDLIIVAGSDGSAIYKVTAVSPDVTVVLFGTLADGTVTTAKIAAGAVTLAKLAAGITPSHVVQYAGKQANGGGSATIAITVTGLTTAHICFAQVQGSTNAVTVQKVTPTSNTLTVLLSGDPGAATTIAYQALLAAS